eukprot:maker-scaffold_57-snap-gene-1.5-mRNA-1 protein AED:0.02 eAED:0.02 QI:115/1/1/1/0.66/0.5/4/31/179
MVNAYLKAQRYAQIQVPSGTWLKFALGSHQEIEEWTFTGTLSETYESLLSAVGELDPKIYDLWKKSSSEESAFIKVTVITPGAKWLDLVELKLRKGEEGETVVAARAYSTGFLPLSIPLAPILNIAFCWFPFQDVDGQCQKELMAIRNNEKVISKLKKVDRIFISAGNPRKGPVDLEKA